MIDVGTNNKALLKDPFYPGIRRLRVEEEVNRPLPFLSFYEQHALFSHRVFMKE